jgi:hypothetical protein
LKLFLVSYQSVGVNYYDKVFELDVILHITVICQQILKLKLVTEYAMPSFVAGACKAQDFYHYNTNLMFQQNVKLTLVTEHAMPSFLTVTFETSVAIAIDAARQANTLVAKLTTPK